MDKEPDNQDYSLSDLQKIFDERADDIVSGIIKRKKLSTDPQLKAILVEAFKSLPALLWESCEAFNALNACSKENRASALDRANNIGVYMSAFMRGLDATLQHTEFNPRDAAPLDTLRDYIKFTGRKISNHRQNGLSPERSWEAMGSVIRQGLDLFRGNVSNCKTVFIPKGYNQIMDDFVSSGIRKYTADFTPPLRRLKHVETLNLTLDENDPGLGR